MRDVALRSACALARPAPSTGTTRRIQRHRQGHVGGVGRVAARGSARERDVNMQLDSLKEETTSAYAEAIDRVKGLAAASHGIEEESPSASQDSSSLQYRLNEAIRELSHGLIERGGRSPPVVACGAESGAPASSGPAGHGEKRARSSVRVRSAPFISFHLICRPTIGRR